MLMDKSWINDTNRFSDRYAKGVESFLKLAKENSKNNDKLIRCPCRDCNNGVMKDEYEVKKDLHIRGFASTYKEHWFLHGERIAFVDDGSGVDNVRYDEDAIVEDAADEYLAGQFDEELDEMLDDVRELQHHGVVSDKQKNDFDRLLKDALREPYPGCKKYSLLSVIVKLLHIKVMNKWTNKSFNMVLEFLKDLLPEGEILPSSLYGARKILSGVGLGYEMIDVCKYDCVIFWKEHEQADTCPICHESRWKYDAKNGNRVPHKILRYFPLKPRLQRLYMSRETAAGMRWHKEKRIDEEDVMKHPADSLAWKELDKLFPHFAQDPRNVRLGLACDGFNPFGHMSSSYSVWPVILVPYNVPPYEIMKESNLLLSLLIPGPNSPGRNLDVYMKPLINELKQLWEDGIQTYDRYSGQCFQMKAAILWTISDLPAYGDLCGHVPHGYLGCPICLEKIDSEKLIHKICYRGHRKWLPIDHPYRTSKIFNNKDEYCLQPEVLSGEEILRWLEALDKEGAFDLPGKCPATKRKRIRTEERCVWVKKSVFFELPYWQKLKIRHNLDVMHIEKNICDNILGTLLNIVGKTKDTDNAQDDKKYMKIKPVACYTLSNNEKKCFCDILQSVKNT